MIFMGLSGRRSLSPLVSLSRATLFPVPITPFADHLGEKDIHFREVFRGVNEVLLGVIECIFALLILHFAKMNIFFA